MLAVFAFRARVEKAWLRVYELLLARSDCAALLAEIAREAPRAASDPHQYDGLFAELLAARAATAGFSHPSEAKRLAEEAFTEVLARFYREITLDSRVTSHPLFLELSRRLLRFPEEVTFAMRDYEHRLSLYRLWHFRCLPAPYVPFSLAVPTLL